MQRFKRIAARIVLAIYLPCALVVFAINVASGPVTLGLSAARAAAWPIWIATGWPQGARLVMD